MPKQDWDSTTADRVSDRIVALVNAEVEAMRQAGTVDPLSIFAGQLLGFLATLSTAPPTRPSSFVQLELAARACLGDIVDRMRAKGTVN